TGEISDMVPKEDLRIITFDNGRRLGWPKIVTDYWPISDRHPLTSGRYPAKKAERLRARHTARVVDPVPSLPGQRIVTDGPVTKGAPAKLMPEERMKGTAGCSAVSPRRRGSSTVVPSDRQTDECVRACRLAKPSCDLSELI